MVTSGRMDTAPAETGDSADSPAPSAPARPPFRRRADAVVFAVLSVLASAWFLWATAALCRNLSPDYATIVEMVRDMAHGRVLPAFFYRQAYMGSLEPGLGALFCRLFGDGPFAVSLGTAVPGLLAVLGLAALAWRLSGIRAAVFALLLAAPGPYVWLHYLVSPRGGYALVALFVVAGLWIASASPVLSGAEPRRVRSAPFLWFGLVCGLAFWNDWLALPVLFGAAVVLALRTGRRILSPRAWGPGLAAFAAGSLPWWVWNARHGWASLDPSSNGLKPIGWLNLPKVAGPKLAAFLGEEGGGASLWPAPLAWILLALFAAAAAGFALSRRRRALAPAAAAVGIGCAVFAAGYAKTSFGAMNAPRYFIPLVPCAALVAGVGLSELVRAAGRRRRAPGIAAAAAAFAAVLACAGAELRLSVSRLAEVRGSSKDRFETFLRWTGAPGLDRPAFGNYDYAHTAANWSTDGRLCIVSPRGGRCPLLLDRLEAAESPSVVDDHAAFSAFLSGTGGKALYRAEDGVRVHHDARPPAAADECPREAIAGIAGPGGAACEDVLLDGNAATARYDGAGAADRVSYEIALAEPRVVCGVVAGCLRSGKAGGWSAEAVLPDGSARPLAAEPLHFGWFWSGPRFYLGGTDERWELRWKAQPLERIRVTFSRLRPGASPHLAEIRLLEPARTPPLDPDAVAAEIRRIEASGGPVRVFADRWLANRLGRSPRDPSVDADVVGRSDAGRAYDARTRLDPRVRSAVVVPEALAPGTEAAFAEAGIAAERTDRGGAAIFVAGGPGREETPRGRTFSGEGCLRFVWGRLLVDRPVPPEIAPDRAVSASFRGGRLELAGCTEFPESVGRGGTGRLGFLLRAPAGAGRLPRGLLVADFRRDGKTVFQAGCYLRDRDSAAEAAGLATFDDLRFPFPVPADAPPGEYEVAVGIRRALESRRYWPVEPGPALGRAGRLVVLPWTLRVE